MLHAKRSRVAWIAALCAVVGLSTSARAELELPRVSPSARVDQTIATTDITVKYSRPGVKGRVIWGDLVPYDKVWRTGANEATTLKTSGPISVAGQPLPAGTYALFTIPGKDEWTVVFNTQAEQWGAFDHDEAQDLVKVTVKPTWTRSEEWMRFTFENLTNTSGELVLRWEKLSLAIPIEVDVTPIVDDVKAAMKESKKDDWRTPYRAASFCMDYGVNKDEGLKWAERSTKVEENYFNLSLLAKFRAEAGKTKQAVELGEKAIALGKKAERPVETLATERLVAQWKENQ
jgi:Protein of unknown function (DUF2911)